MTRLVVNFVMTSLLLIQAAGLIPTELKVETLRWEATRASFVAFNANVVRTGRMIEAPAFAAITADAHRLAAHRVCGGEPTAKRLNRIPNLGQKMEAIIADQLNRDPDTIRLAMTALLQNLDNFIQHTEQVRPVFESFLSAILIQAWTSLEVLFRQLLRETIGRHPLCFTFLTAEELSKNRSGNFQRLETMRRAYDATFNKETTVSNRVNEQCVDGLYFVRNLLVHRAGIVDATFKTECGLKDFTAWAALPEGSNFPATGEVVRSLVGPNMNCGYSLLQAVDQWLTKHQDLI